MMRERESTGTMAVVEVERVNQLLRGSGQGELPSCFIDAIDLQDCSDEDWLEEDTTEDNYTKFGNMRKINF